MHVRRPDDCIVATTIGDAYTTLLGHLLHNGAPVDVRGFHTVERINLTLSVERLDANVLVNPVRSPNYRFMVAEWLWIWFGHSTLSPLTRVNSQMAKFSDDGVSLAGAYGPRLHRQWAYVIDTLRKDPSSRQAVMTIWTPNPRPSRDIPCTISFQFLLRDETLHCTANMRSSDAWLGVPYDFFTFSQLANTVAGHLKVGLGSLTMNLGSSHLYAEHWGIAKECFAEKSRTILSPKLPGAPVPALEHAMLTGEPCIVPAPWNTYSNVLSCKSTAEALEHLRNA